MRKGGQKCEAPDCARAAIIAKDGHTVCNLHYLRLLNHGSFDLPVRKLSRHCTCARCGKQFDRGYAINGNRARNPQFCSVKCRAAEARDKAVQKERDRFWGKVEVRSPDECWEWTAMRSPGGYGRFSRPGREGTQLASRIAYELTFGQINDERMFVCHKCDNPPCCNPSHLFLGTAKDNMADAAAKGRTNRVARVFGESHPQAKLTPELAVLVYHSKLPDKVLAQKYGVTAAAIYNVKHGKAWAWATGAKNAAA